jgi:hypothetical protein
VSALGSCFISRLGSRKLPSEHVGTPRFCNIHLALETSRRRSIRPAGTPAATGIGATCVGGEPPIKVNTILNFRDRSICFLGRGSRAGSICLGPSDRRIGSWSASCLSCLIDGLEAHPTGTFLIPDTPYLVRFTICKSDWVWVLQRQEHWTSNWETEIPNRECLTEPEHAELSMMYPELRSG